MLAINENSDTEHIHRVIAAYKGFARRIFPFIASTSL